MTGPGRVPPVPPETFPAEPTPPARAPIVSVLEPTSPYKTARISGLLSDGTTVDFEIGWRTALSMASDLLRLVKRHGPQ